MFIYKVAISILDSRTNVHVGNSDELIKCEVSKNVGNLWFLRPEHTPNMSIRSFECYSTGEQIDRGRKYVGTLIYDYLPELHVFEIL